MYVAFEKFLNFEIFTDYQKVKNQEQENFNTLAMKN